MNDSFSKPCSAGGVPGGGKVIRLVFVCLGLAVGLSGCGDRKKGGEASATQEKLVLLCGNSFVPPTEELIRGFEEREGVKIEYTSAGSEDFLPQVKAGAQGDILVTHDPFLDFTKEAGRLLDSAEAGFVAPVLAVQPGNPKGLTKIEDLTKEGLRVALTDKQYSTCGEMVFALLEKKGIKDQVMANVGNRLTKGHSALGNYLKVDAVDAVVMWNGVAHTFLPDVEIVPSPYEYDSEIRVHVIGLNYTKKPELVKKFIAYARERAPEVFRENGYIKYEK